jgi:hypothetical protein
MQPPQNTVPLCAYSLHFTCHKTFQISLFTATPIILYQYVPQQLSVCLSLLCTGGSYLPTPYSTPYLPTPYSPVPSTAINPTHVTTTECKQFLLTKLSFHLNPVHFQRTLSVLQFSLGTPQTLPCFMSVAPSLPARSAAVAISVRADFGVFRRRNVTVRLHTAISLW